MDELYYIGQKAFIRKDGNVLVLESPFYGLDFPGGKIKKGEGDVIEALKREVREETSLEIEVGDPFTTWDISFTDSEGKERKIFLIGYECVYTSGKVSLSKEHKGYQWVNKENYRQLQERNDYFKALEKYFLK